MLSYAGWINGLSVVIIIIYGCGIGIFYIYKSKKDNAKLLSYMGIISFFVSLGWLGGFIDFWVIILTGQNMNNSFGIFGILNMIWAPLVYIFAVLLGFHLVIPNKERIKWLILSIMIILNLIYEFLVIFTAENSFIFFYPPNPGEDLLDASIEPNSILNILITIHTFIIIALWGVGFLSKTILSKGVIRKKYSFLSLGTLLYFIFGLIDLMFFFKIYIMIFVRFGVVSSFLVFYFGLKEESYEPEKKPKKELKIEEGLFRLIKKPDYISEEEVTFHKEKKICLVCKGKITRLMYTCPGCDALYCPNCSEALSNMENACWVCNTPFDESKPVKLPKNELDQIKIDKTDKTVKK